MKKLLVLVLSVVAASVAAKKMTVEEINELRQFGQKFEQAMLVKALDKEAKSVVNSFEKMKAYGDLPENSALEQKSSAFAVKTTVKVVGFLNELRRLKQNSEFENIAAFYENELKKLFEQKPKHTSSVTVEELKEVPEAKEVKKEESEQSITQK